MTPKNDPRYVAVAAARLAPSPHVWIKGSALERGDKALVIFTTDGVRLYPLTDERRATGKPVKFCVAPDTEVRSSDHVIHQSDGISIYVPIASRQERVQWAIDKMRPASLLDHLDVITELQHLICHRAVTEALVIDDVAIQTFQRYLLRALHGPFSGASAAAQIVCARTAIAYGKELAFDKEGTR